MPGRRHGVGKTLQTITLLLKSQKPVYPQIYEGLFAGLKVETPSTSFVGRNGQHRWCTTGATNSENLPLR
jgi:hypothetical protein